jgi:hypothetical protein
MFANITADTDWDLSSPMLWGYFFTHRTRGPLDRAGKLLQHEGYQLVKVYLADKESHDEEDLWWLHVARIEAHSVESLESRNRELAAFAERVGLDSYDGMDVGPPPA